MKLIQIIYASTAAIPFKEAQLLAMLEKYRENNANRNITGILLFKDGNFMQVLEGLEKDVMPLFERISKDRRHFGVITLYQSEVADREFPEWSMAFRNLDGADVSRHPGYSEFLSTSLKDSSFIANQSKAKRLISIFRSSAR